MSYNIDMVGHDERFCGACGYHGGGWIVVVHDSPETGMEYDDKCPECGEEGSYDNPVEILDMWSKQFDEVEAAAYERGKAAGWHECCDAWEDWEGECPEALRSRYPREVKP